MVSFSKITPRDGVQVAHFPNVISKIDLKKQQEPEIFGKSVGNRIRP